MSFQGTYLPQAQGNNQGVTSMKEEAQQGTEWGRKQWQGGETEKVGPANKFRVSGCGMVIRIYL